MRRRLEGGLQRIFACRFLLASFAAGVVVTALLHAWLWPSHPPNPLATAIATGEIRSVMENAVLEDVPKSGFEELRVPWSTASSSTNPPAIAPKHPLRRYRKVVRSQPIMRTPVASEPPSPVRAEPRRWEELRQPAVSAWAAAKTPLILEETPPSISPVQNNAALLTSLELPPVRVPEAPLPDKLTTQTYNGIVVDAACATPAKVTAREKKDRRCAVSSTTATFALRLDDGQTLRFDSVGNLRAQNAKRKNRWAAKTAAGKEIRAKISGAIVGDQMIVVSIE
jgi:hypothetical protein